MAFSQSFKSLCGSICNRSYPRNHYSIYRTYCKALESRQAAIQDNPYFEKYSQKIAEAQKISPEDFQANLEKNLKAMQIKPLAMDRKSDVEKKGTSVIHKRRQKDLNQIMKMEALQEKTAEEIETIWKQYHQIKDGVYAVLPSSAYEKMHLILKQYPTFLFPLPRAQGYEFAVFQFLDQSCYFTSLLNYQTHQENAPVCLTVTYFTEFQEEKGIVLMRGEYDSDVLKAHEAQCLTNQLQLYYGGSDEKKTQLVATFNTRPDHFKHTDLISNFEAGLGQC